MVLCTSFLASAMLAAECFINEGHTNTNTMTQLPFYHNYLHLLKKKKKKLPLANDALSQVRKSLEVKYVYDAKNSNWIWFSFHYSIMHSFFPHKGFHLSYILKIKTLLHMASKIKYSLMPFNLPAKRPEHRSMTLSCHSHTISSLDQHQELRLPHLLYTNFLYVSQYIF